MKKKLFTGDSEFWGPKWLVLNHVPNTSWCHLNTFILKIYFWKGWEWGIWGWRSGVLELCTTTTGSLGTLFYLSVLLGKTRRWTLGSFSVSICHLYLFYFILQYCSGFCHTLTWISHGFTCVPHPDPPSRLPPHPIPLGLPSAPALSTCLMHQNWTGDLIHHDNIHVSMLFSQIIPLSPSPTESKNLFYTSVSLLLFCT